MPDEPKVKDNRPARAPMPKDEAVEVKEAPPKVVCLHTGVGPFSRGQVVCSSAWGAERCTQLMNNGAIRFATKEESLLERVDLDNQNAAPANQLHVMAEKLKNKDAMIDQLSREVQMLKSLNETAAASAAETNNIELLKKVAESEATIKSLQAQLAEAQKKLAEVKSE